MQERLLQFIWQFQYFNTKNLQTTNAENLVILDVGQLNKNQGADFLEAKIKVGNTILAGNIELHIKSSDWFLHKHDDDKNYQNIILHVVWEDDKQIPNAKFPTLELQSLVASSMLKNYEILMNSSIFVPCEKYLPAISSLQWTVWKDRLLVERLERKSYEIEQLLQQTKQDWSEVFWRMLAKSFGSKTNADVFFQMASSLPLNILAKHKNQLNTLEALLFGQCGLLEDDVENDYAKMLQREYRYLAKKYSLKHIEKQPAFLRMRPQNFPTIRLAQLASLIHQSNHLFSKMKEAESYNSLKSMLLVKANDYWNEHFTLKDENHNLKPKQLGKSMIDIIIINTIVSLVFIYGKINNQDVYKDKALRWLSEIKSEENNIIQSWRNVGVACISAFDSQALLELKNNYCNEKKCLDCTVGNGILKK
ncbi:hypothetical protein A9P82_00940 [Arachidicoccus ginsenosidimutans]|uniref:DUF2851 family protein n=1 Tax=Arachidicoccus sp. BS20 TaxID=1850526 RepID=UPI0007F0730C|nr:DUF2851 family protein [Arachidicoccus sp. BS20]ANI88009.1 hypothetical protein A9P82_00940 [Arachidicoccus sp. BS20]